MSRPNAPTAPVWIPTYSPSLHTNDRVISRIRDGPTMLVVAG